MFKHRTAVSKNVYFDVLDYIAHKYNNVFHTTIKMNSTDVKSDSYAEYNVESNEKYSIFVTNHVSISKYKNIFAEGYTPD